MAMLNPTYNPLLLAGVALCVAFFSASQDIAFDAYRTDLLPEKERGLGSALTTGGYRIAMLVAGGLALVFADQFGWRMLYLLMAMLMVINAWFALRAPHLNASTDLAASSLYQAIIQPFQAFLSRPGAWLILLFILLYKLTDVLALSLNTTFLLRALHFTLTEVGSIYKTVGLGGTLLGCFLGGLWMQRLSLFDALLYFGFLQGISALVFMVLAIVGKHYGLMVSAIFIESLCSGMGTIALMAFLMSLCDRQYTATQFAIFSSLASVGRVVGGPIAGLLVSYMGWASFFLLAFLAALPGLALLYAIRGKIDAPLAASLCPEAAH
jgi:PAT family beta-lactamase induction signal transducer AmpG